ncbi:MAG: terminase TerL endonuclease subunit [Candidatus Onthovivens sp.]|nr:terminase TerL endonuclease subunit [Candidatus Onthovivens sp.]
MKLHPSYKYAEDVIKGNIIAPKYVKKQCQLFLNICDNKDNKYCVNEKRVNKIDKIAKVLKMAKGIKAGESIYNSLAGYQWLMIIASLCVVYRDNTKKRRYENVVLEIARKNGKTFTVAFLFLLLFYLEPPFSRFFSVAPDGSLAKEIKEALEPLIRSNYDVLGEDEFKILRDSITLKDKSTKYVPLNYSTSRMDGKEPSVFIADEVGALPTAYPVEAMRSGQLLIKNKLGFVISTKYPTIKNPFEEEVQYQKEVLDGIHNDETTFSLLFEPDEEIKEEWTTNDEVIIQANPLAIEVDAVKNDLLKKRTKAISQESLRENFLTKHCNIIYQGLGTESFIDIAEVQKCKVAKIDWTGKQVYLGVDLSMTNDNCAVAMTSVDDDNNILADVISFIPEGRIDEKNQFERIDYREFIKAMKCIACGNKVVDYGVIEDFVFKIEEQYGVTIMAIGYDKWNALSSAQKWNKKYNCVEIRQHSDTLHSPTKLLQEKILNGEFKYEPNKLLEINFENARCTYDTNMNRYVTKKKSNGKVDMVVALINSIYLLEQDVLFNQYDFVVQVI